MKKIFFLLLLFPLAGMAQVYQVLPQYGYEMKRVNPTLVLQLPTDTVNNKLGIARVGSTLYVGNGTYWTGGSGNYLDSFWRVSGIDSNYYRINGVTYAVLDSTGGASLTALADTAAAIRADFPTGGSGTQDSLVITPNIFAGLGLNDVEKIQRALDTAISQKKQLLIPFNKERGSKYWMIDSAILLRSNANIVIQNSVLKLSDSARDNIFRTANCGIGITTPYLNPYTNISIVGVGEAALEGADNPRSTGDAGKTLSLNPSAVAGTQLSYGTDNGKVGRSQYGDWRNYGAIIAYTTNVKVSGLQLNYLHAYGISFERCSQVNVMDINVNMPGYAAGGASRIIKNNGAIDFNQSINYVYVNNIFGISADDNIALNIINVTPGTGGAGGAGDTRAYHATGDTSNAAIDSISNVNISNVNSRVYDNSVRILVPPNGCKASNINISNITDNISPADDLWSPYGSGANSSVIIIGSNNPVYGGNNPLGQISKVNISNIRSSYTKYGVWVQTTLAESTVSQLFKESTTYASTPALYTATPGTAYRNLIRYGDEIVLPTQTNSLLIGAQVSVATPPYPLEIHRSENALVRAALFNINTGTSASAYWQASNAASSMHFGITGFNYTGSGNLLSNTGVLQTTASTMLIRSIGAFPIIFETTAAERMRILSGGNIGIGVKSPTAYLHLKAGTATASTAPLKFTSGTKLTTVENGAVEYDGTNYYASSGGVRYTLQRVTSVPASASATGVTGSIAYDSSFIYVCVSTNTWVRAALATW